MTYKVLILPDWENWSCDFTSGYIVKHLPHMQFEKRYSRYLHERPLIRADDDFDAVWMMLHYGIETLVSQISKAGQLGKMKILVGVRGPYGIDKADTWDLRHVDALGVQSRWAYYAMREKIPHYDRIWITYDGVDHKVFRPMPEHYPPKGKFIVGWAGQSRLAVKRTKEIKQVCQEGGFDLKFADCWPMQGKYAVPHDQMPIWYNTLSTFFHFSTREGAPRPVIEAASSGIPVITSPTGYGQEVIQEDLHVYDEIQALQKLMWLSGLPDERAKIGKRNRDYVLNHWTWEKRAPRYEEFFKLEGEPYQEINT